MPQMSYLWELTQRGSGGKSGRAAEVGGKSIQIVQTQVNSLTNLNRKKKILVTIIIKMEYVSNNAFPYNECTF